MKGLINTTDKLDVHALAKRHPSDVWIPPAQLRDLRELTRTRLVMVASRTPLKNRLNATLAKYGWTVAASDPFGVGARPQWQPLLALLPELLDCGRRTELRSA